MAFPGTYDFSYYKGDTLEFRVYPKDAAGEVFDLSTFSNVKFTVSTTLGTDGLATQKECYAQISSDKTYVLCAIQPAIGNQLDATKVYVYDVEISKSGTPYPFVYTILNGKITIKDQVTGAV
jgi:hypothetical protein